MTDMARLLATGEAHKRRAATSMNARSTRAHTVVILNRELDGVQNKFFFADLGGSETLSKSNAAAEVKMPVLVVGDEEVERITWAEYYGHRKRVEETLNINRGLFALKKCVDALHTREAARKAGEPLPYVPYQDAKLTMLLAEGLGGSAKTAVVCACSRDDAHAIETIQTLRFGERCSSLTARTEVTEGHLARALAGLEKEVAAKERWEERRVKRKDERHGADTEVVKELLVSQGRLAEAQHVGSGEAMGGEEEIVTSVLVGAEKERAILEKLLRQKRELLGDTAEDKDDWAAAKQAWHDQSAKQVLLPHERKLEKRFSPSALAQEPGLVADGLEFIFRKTTTARGQGYDDAFYAGLAQQLASAGGAGWEPHAVLKELCALDLDA